MKRINRKGSMELSGVAMAVIVTIVSLFIGLYIINTVSALIPQNQMKDYSYTTAVNSTVDYTNGTKNVTHNITIGAFASISGETPDKTITTIVTNTNATDDYTVTVYLNDVSIGSFTASNNTATTNIITAVDFTESATNTILYTSNGNAELLDVNSTTVKYPSATTDTGFGTIYTSLTTDTATIFDVLILVVIVVVLGIAIGSLRNFSGAASGSSAV